MSRNVILFDESPARRLTYSIGLDEFGFNTANASDMARLVQLLGETQPDGVVLGCPDQDSPEAQVDWALRQILDMGISCTAIVLADQLPPIEKELPGNVIFVQRPCGLTPLVAGLYQGMGIKVSS